MCVERFPLPNLGGAGEGGRGGEGATCPLPGKNANYMQKRLNFVHILRPMKSRLNFRASHGTYHHARKFASTSST